MERTGRVFCSLGSFGFTRDGWMTNGSPEPAHQSTKTPSPHTAVAKHLPSAKGFTRIPAQVDTWYCMQSPSRAWGRFKTHPSHGLVYCMCRASGTAGARGYRCVIQLKHCTLPQWCGRFFALACPSQTRIALACNFGRCFAPSCRLRKGVCLSCRFQKPLGHEYWLPQVARKILPASSPLPSDISDEL